MSQSQSVLGTYQNLLAQYNNDKRLTQQLRHLDKDLTNIPLKNQEGTREHEQAFEDHYKSMVGREYNFYRHTRAPSNPVPSQPQVPTRNTLGQPAQVSYKPTPTYQSGPTTGNVYVQPPVPSRDGQREPIKRSEHEGFNYQQAVLKQEFDRKSREPTGTMKQPTPRQEQLHKAYVDKYNYKLLHEPLLRLPRVSSKYMSSEYATNFNPLAQFPSASGTAYGMFSKGKTQDLMNVKSVGNLGLENFPEHRLDSAIGQKEYQGDEQLIPFRERNTQQQARVPHPANHDYHEDSLADYANRVQKIDQQKKAVDTEYMYNRGARSNYGDLQPREATDFNTLQKSGEFFPTSESRLPLPESVHLVKNEIGDRYQLHDLSRWNNKIVYDGGRIKDAPAPGLSEPERYKMLGISAQKLRLLEDEYSRIVGTQKR